MKVLRPNFTLLKCRKIGGGSIAYEYKVTVDVGGVQHEKKHEVESTYVAHPDLMKIFEELDAIYIKSKGRDVIHNIGQLDLPASKLKSIKSTDTQKILGALNALEYENTTSTGISIQYKDKDVISAVVSGKTKHKNGSSIGSATTKIDLRGVLKFGIEDELKDCCERLIEEVFCFEFEGKHNQTEMKFEEPKKEAA